MLKKQVKMITVKQTQITFYEHYVIMTSLCKKKENKVRQFVQRFTKTDTITSRTEPRNFKFSCH